MSVQEHPAGRFVSPCEAAAWPSCCSCPQAFGKMSWPQLDGQALLGNLKKHLIEFCCSKACVWGRQRMDQGGCFLAEEPSAWHLFSWQACAEMAGSSKRSKQYDFEKPETFSTPSGGIRGQDVRRAVYSWGSIGCCQMLPGEATMLLQTVSTVYYRQCPLPSQGRKACLNIPNGLQETLLVCETLATMSYAVPCCRLSFAAWLMLS